MKFSRTFLPAPAFCTLLLPLVFSISLPAKAEVVLAQASRMPANGVITFPVYYDSMNTAQPGYFHEASSDGIAPASAPAIAPEEDKFPPASTDYDGGWYH